MNDSDRLAIALAASKPLEIECLLTPDQRRTITPEEHQAFREEVTPPPHDFDEIDEAAAMVNPTQRRSESQVNRVLELLDSLPPAARERRSA